MEGHPSELNLLLRSGGLDVSPNSSIEYAVRPDLYLLCPGISIAAHTRVMSVLLLSNMPLRELPPDPIAVTGASDTLRRAPRDPARGIPGTPEPARADGASAGKGAAGISRVSCHRRRGAPGVRRRAWRRTSPTWGNGGSGRPGSRSSSPCGSPPASAWEGPRKGAARPVRRRPARGQAVRPGIDPARGVPVGRPGLDVRETAGGLLALPFVRPRRGNGGALALLPAGGKVRKDPLPPPLRFLEPHRRCREARHRFRRRPAMIDKDMKIEEVLRQVPADDPRLPAVRDRLRPVPAVRIRKPRARGQGPRDRPADPAGGAERRDRGEGIALFQVRRKYSARASSDSHTATRATRTGGGTRFSISS